MTGALAGELAGSIFLYVMAGYVILMALDLCNSSIMHVLPTKGKRGYVTVPLFVWMAWPFAILLYILMVPVLLVKGIVYMFKHYKDWT